MKRIKISILICSMIIVLAGCGKRDDSPPSSITESTEEVSEEVSEAKDTSSPEITPKEDYIVSKVDEAIDYDDFFTVSDDTDAETDIEISVDDARVDVKSPGKYSVKISAADKSNNSSEIEIPVYIYKEYSHDEISDIISKLIDEKYYDFITYDSDTEYPEDEEHLFQVYDETNVTDNPTGNSQVIGNIDYIVNYVGARIDISSEDYSNKNKNVDWNTDFIINYFEFTVTGDVQEVDRIEIISKEGKIVLNTTDNVYGENYIKYDESDAKYRRVEFCFDSEEDIEEFEKIINGNNAMYKVYSDTDELITSLSIEQENVENLNSALSFYKSLNEYICNVPKNIGHSSQYDEASDTDAD